MALKTRYNFFVEPCIHLSWHFLQCSYLRSFFDVEGSFVTVKTFGLKIPDFDLVCIPWILTAEGLFSRVSDDKDCSELMRREGIYFLEQRKHYGNHALV